MFGRFIKMELCIISCIGSSVCGDYGGSCVMEISGRRDWVAKTDTWCAWHNFLLAPIYSCSCNGHCLHLSPQWSVFSCLLPPSCAFPTSLRLSLSSILHLKFPVLLQQREWILTLWKLLWFELLVSVHPIANELEVSTEPSDLKMQKVVRDSLVLCTGIYLCTAMFAYLLFGEATSDDVLANFDTDLGIPFAHTIALIVRASYAVHIMLVFPLLHYSLRLNVDGLLFPKAHPLVHDNLRFVLLTGVLVGLIFIGSTLVPNIWVAFQFTGATASVCLAFIFPALILLKWVQCFWCSMCHGLNHISSIFSLVDNQVDFTMMLMHADWLLASGVGVVQGQAQDSNTKRQMGGLGNGNIGCAF